MGTRSLTIMLDEDGQEIAVLYRQMDGYPEGHGAELAEFLAQFTMVNGISLVEKRQVANGAECLAAQIVAHFKDGPGGFYLHRAGTRDAWEDYRYYVSAGVTDQPIRIRVEQAGWKEIPDKDLFEGTAEEMLAWLARPRVDEEEEEA